MNQTLKLFLMSCAAIMMVGLLLPAEQVQAQQGDPLVRNPEYTAWARFKPGTTVYLKETRQQDDKVFVTYIRTRLISVDDMMVKVSIRHDPVVDGKTIKGVVREQSILAELPKSKLDDVFNPPTKNQEGYMDLTINQRPYRCFWVQSNPGGDAQRVLWTHKDVPGYVVRYFAKSKEKRYQRNLQLYQFKVVR